MSDFVANILKTVSIGKSLTIDEANQFMDALMSGTVSPIQTAGLLAAMTVRGESVDEIVGFAKAMRRQSKVLVVPQNVIDTCGTGGDGADTFNISTTAAIVSAAAGAFVAKHGNRAASSRSGSACVLEALGVRIDLSVDEAARCLQDTNLCFLFAPQYHPAMKHAIEPRTQLGFRTIFNVLGPLTNPAQAKRQVLGVYRPELVLKMAEALVKLDTVHALVVHGEGAIDELSIAGETLVAEVRHGQIIKYVVTPEEMGLNRAELSTIRGGDPAENAKYIRNVLGGELSPKRDVVLLNAGAALYVAGLTSSIKDGVQLAAQSIDSHAALDTLNQLVKTTHQLKIAEVAQ